MDFLPPTSQPHLVNNRFIHNLINSHEERDLIKRKISSEIDLFLGFEVYKIEEWLREKALSINPESIFGDWGPLLHHGAQTWIGVDFQILQSSYHDLKTIFNTIRPKANDLIIDLGAGYGRMGIYLHWYHPLTRFIGLELVSERVAEGNRIYDLLALKNKHLVECDLSHLTALPQGDIYFIYDFGSVKHIQKILDLLYLMPNKKLIVKGQICHDLLKKDLRFNPGQKLELLHDVFLYQT